MTNKEALKDIKNHIGDGTMQWTNLVRTDVLIVASKALEKQIPKKPSGDEDIKLCPVCRKVVLLMGHTAKKKFCPNCGQAIDWSEVTE